ncbi:MAG: phytanoyl-CoA dioxygenase family protein [Azospirillaceae bacterium]
MVDAATAARGAAIDWDITAAALARDGFCVVPGVLDTAMLDRARRLSRGRLDAADGAHRSAQRSTGSMIHMAEEPGFAELIAWHPALDAFERLGLGGARYSSGYVISKPPGGPPLFWHQDWWGWDHPASYDDRMLQVFAMYYLTDTTRENGCLRAIPGSHRRRHPMHDRLARAHGEDMAKMTDPDDPAFGALEGEVDVPVAAGDLVIGDARLLHGAHANRSGAERTLLTLWYHPGFADQPAAIKARVARIMHREEAIDTDPDAPARFPDVWPDTARATVAPVLATHDGPEAPHPWNRIPDARLA